MGIFDCLFNKKKPVELPAIQPPRDQNQIKLIHAVQIALEITSSFEGLKKFANVSGNFDGQGLSCGALSFAWRMGRQQPLVLDLLKKDPSAFQLMPQYGKEYVNLAKMHPEESYRLIAKWTMDNGELYPHIKRELEALWGCQNMVDIQTQESMKLGQRVLHAASEWSQKSRKKVSPILLQFVFFFDVFVQNGSLDGITYEEVRSYFGTWNEDFFKNILDLNSSMKDLQNNVKHWQEILHGKSEMQLELFMLGYLRALKCDRFEGSVMNRKGTIALMSGYVNRSFYDLSQQYFFLIEDSVV